MTGDLTTSSAADFPASNLGPSAQKWARAVAQRIAKLEDRSGRHGDSLLDLNHGVISALRLAGHSNFRWRGDWVGENPGVPGADYIATGYGGGAS